MGVLTQMMAPIDAPTRPALARNCAAERVDLPHKRERCTEYAEPDDSKFETLQPFRHALVPPDKGALLLQRLLQRFYRNVARNRVAR